MRLAFLASGSGGLIGRIVDVFGRDSRIALAGLVADRPGIGALEVTARAGIETKIVARASGEAPESYSRRLLEALEPLAPDWLFLTFDHLLAAPVLRRWENRIVNVHYSLLPAFAGFGAVRSALAQGTRSSGVTLHLVDRSPDGGPIVIQGIAPIHEGDTTETLQDRLFHLAVPMALQVVDWIADRRIETFERTGRIQVKVRGARSGTLPVNPWPEKFEELVP